MTEYSPVSRPVVIIPAKLEVIIPRVKAVGVEASMAWISATLTSSVVFE